MRAYDRVRVERAYQQRAQLMRLLGNECRHCGVSGDEEALEFDHVVKRTWVAAEVGRWTRMARYTQDFLRGHLALACRSCNASAGPPRRKRIPSRDWLGVYV